MRIVISYQRINKKTKEHNTMSKIKSYRITATVIDSNGMRVSSNNAQTLGDLHRVHFLDWKAAEVAMNELQGDINFDHPEWQAELELTEEAFNGFEEGVRYDVQSVRDAGFTIDDAGYQIGDYFDAMGRYLGPDQHGIEPTMDE